MSNLSCLPIPNHLLKKCQVLNSRDDILPLLDNQLMIAELGVADGSFSELLSTKAKFLALIDLYKNNDWPTLNRFNSETHYDFIRNKFRDYQHVKVLSGDHIKMLQGFDDDFDLIYIDGGSMPHYQTFKDRLFFAYGKIKLGGLLWINDYTTHDPYTETHYGCQKAVNELINTYHLEVIYLSLNSSNFHDICLRKTSHKMPEGISETRVALYSTQYGNFFMFRNEEFISEPMKRGEHWDQKILNIVLPYLQKTDTVIDVGAHIGCHTIPYASRVNRVYAFEPQTVMHRLLVKNLATNHIYNVKTGKFAVGHLNDMEVTISSQCQDGQSKDHKISYDTDQVMNYGGIQLGMGEEKVVMKTLDGFQFRDKIRYIKVDAEGSEPLIFYGARELIKRDRPIILFEQRESTQITKEMKTIMNISPEIENFSIEDYCVKELNYNRPLLIDGDHNLLLIPRNVSLPRSLVKDNPQTSV